MAFCKWLDKASGINQDAAIRRNHARLLIASTYNYDQLRAVDHRQGELDSVLKVRLWSRGWLHVDETSIDRVLYTRRVYSIQQVEDIHPVRGMSARLPLRQKVELAVVWGGMFQSEACSCGMSWMVLNGLASFFGGATRSSYWRP